MKKASNFQFLNFSVQQRQDVFKITSDSLVLAGTQKLSLDSKVLDVGTGSGILSLLLADRFPTAVIDAIELQEHAVTLAQTNVEHHPMGRGITVHHAEFSQWEKTGYDLVITNPPYFENDLTSPQRWKNVARHHVHWNWERFFTSAMHWLKPSGRLSLIIPHHSAQSILQKASYKKLYLWGQLQIKDQSDSPIKLEVLTFSLQPEHSQSPTQLILKEKDHKYTAQYKQLLRGWVNWD